jgi:preprotein translocase subunit SecA
MLSQLKKNLFDAQTGKLKKYKKIVDQINALERDLVKLSDEELKNKTNEFKERLNNGETIDDIKAEAFAVVKEAAFRVIGMKHYDVQLIGGLALVDGNIAEMATGEGKTLVASLPCYLRALEGKGVHMITVNDYLARRDREIIGPIHEFLGLTVGLNLPQMGTAEKQKAYQADITYGVGNEFGFDYLRDHLVRRPEERVQRPFHYAILDEADSILIDEARTPLIIAGKAGLSKELFYLTAKLVKGFKRDVHYKYEPELKVVSLLDEGISLVENAFDVDNLYDRKHQLLYHYVLQSLRAEVLFKRDVDYIVSEGEIKLVDPFTGRIMEGRSLSYGLHQAIEAKEGLKLTEENKTQAAITIQNYFRSYPLLAGMTGTAKTEEEEFQMIYGMDVIQIPTNRPKIRVDLPDIIFKTKAQKYTAVTKEVKKRHEKGQPVLIGTTSIEQSEELATYLDKAGLSYQLLNAKNVEREAQMIALAGQLGQITISTNMAGRGTDIILGEGVAEVGGLHVIGTERHESRRIDNQLKGRAGRQGDPGSSQFFISLEDDLLERYASENIDKIRESVKVDDDGRVTDKSNYDFVDRIQRICESIHYSSREYTLKLDDTINDQRRVLYTIRNDFLNTEDIRPLLYKMIESSVHHLIDRYCPDGSIPEEWEKEKLVQELHQFIPGITEIPADLDHKDDVKNYLDGILASYQKALNNLDTNVLYSIRQTALSIIDVEWMNHLENMERLKEGIGLQGYAQVDPMMKYQEEGFIIFKETYAKVEQQVAKQTLYYYTADNEPNAIGGKTNGAF